MVNFSDPWWQYSVLIYLSVAFGNWIGYSIYGGNKKKEMFWMSLFFIFIWIGMIILSFLEYISQLYKEKKDKQMDELILQDRKEAVGNKQNTEDAKIEKSKIDRKEFRNHTRNPENEGVAQLKN